MLFKQRMARRKRAGGGGENITTIIASRQKPRHLANINRRLNPSNIGGIARLLKRAAKTDEALRRTRAELKASHQNKSQRRQRRYKSASGGEGGNIIS